MSQNYVYILSYNCRVQKFEFSLLATKKKPKLQEVPDQDDSQIEEILTNGTDTVGNGTDAIEHIDNPNESMNNSHDTNHVTDMSPMVFKTDPLDESQIEEINLEDSSRKRNHLCQVCGNSFASESQLFNHFDASSSKRIR